MWRQGGKLWDSLRAKRLRNASPPLFLFLVILHLFYQNTACPFGRIRHIQTLYFFHFHASKQLPLTFSWLCRIMQEEDLGQGKEWQQTDLAAVNKGVWTPFQNSSIVPSFCQLIAIPDHPPFTHHVEFIVVSFSVEHVYDNRKVFSYGGIKIH